MCPLGSAAVCAGALVQGYLAHKKPPPPRTLQQGFAQGPMPVLGGGAVSYERGTPSETGISLPNNQRQHRTSHAPKDVLPSRICANTTPDITTPTNLSYIVTLPTQPCNTHWGMRLHLLPPITFPTQAVIQHIHRCQPSHSPPILPFITFLPFMIDTGLVGSKVTASGGVSRGEKMLFSGTDPESCIT